MNMEELSKSQIVLLTLLVTFVTSIATGIVTVSLMDQAPPAVAQTVNRIIERTIQTVASTTPRGQTATTVVTQEKTVIVKESDLISQAVQKVSPSVVRLSTSDAESPMFLGLGVVLDAGTIIADTGSLGESGDAVVQLSDGSHVRAFITSRNSTLGIAYLTAATTTVDGKPVSWTPVSIASGNPLLGETVVILAGRTITRIAGGIVTAVVPSDGDTPEVIETDIAADSIISGSPLINTDGSLVGFSTGSSRGISPSGFISTSVLVKAPSKGTDEGKK